MSNPTVQLSAMSQLSPLGFHTSPCGYCRTNMRQEEKSQQRDRPHGNVDSEGAELESGASYYARASQLQPADYQILLNHGWRRSGTLLYKPEMRRSCCPHYTIRLPVGDIRTRKDQRSACNRWNKFILGEDYVKQAAKLHPKSRAEKQRQRNEFDLGQAIHAAERSRLPPEPEPEHRFEIAEEPSAYTDEKYELYLNYQTHVHHEPVSKSDKSGFKRFLCESPLVPTTVTIDGKQRSYASVHQCYRLDGRLIAMAVLDLLPDGVSAVYFMYHSDFEQWSFGKLSALREAAYAREHGYEFYYMGYYINSCAKMRYKNDFQPQFFLDLIDKSWHKLDETAQEQMTQLGFYSPAEVARDERPVMTPGNVAFETGEMTGTSNEQRHRARAAMLVAGMEHAISTEGKSLFELDFAGMQTLEQVRPLLGDVGIRLPGGGFCQAKNLVKWKDWDEEDPASIKGLIAELLACIGPEINSRIVANFG